MNWLRQLVPASFRRWITRQTRWPRVGGVTVADLRRTTPISRSWGGDRGEPVDRRYISRFLESRAADIRGRVLEFGDDRYSTRLGGVNVSRADVGDVSPHNPKATLLVDLGKGTGLPDAAFDCIVCTQTIHLIADPEAAIRALRAALKPGGVLLLTVPGISHTVRDDRNPWTDYWRYTSSGLAHLLMKSFARDGIEVVTYGNVFSAIAFLHGLAAEELTSEELSAEDASYPVIVAARAVVT